MNKGLFRLGNLRLGSVGDGNSKKKGSLTWIWTNLNFDSFRPELLKMRIARIVRGSHMECFLKSSHKYSA